MVKAFDDTIFYTETPREGCEWP